MGNTRITFDAATLADAVGKAARVSPTKGAAFDRAAGITFNVDPHNGQATILATDIDTSYLQIIKGTDCIGDTRQWRIPSATLASLVSALPMGAGSLVTFIDTGDGAIRIKSSTVTVKLQMYEGDFPMIETFAPSGFSEAYDFSQKAARVTWACAKDTSVLSGVHVDGESLIGCDRTVAAIIPCKVPITKPITVPLFNLGPILRTATDVRVGANDKRMLIQLDAETQATTSIFEGNYPDVKKLRRTDWKGHVMIPRTRMLDSLARMMVVGRSDRMPTVKLEFSTGLVPTVTLDLEVESGRIQDKVDVTGEFDDYTILFTPQYIVPALENAKDEMVKFEFVPGDPLKPVHITDSTGYEALITPRRP